MDLFSTGYSATDLVANVATAVQTTLAGVAPIVEIVVGVILAFVFARYIIGLFKHVGKK